MLPCKCNSSSGSSVTAPRSSSRGSALNSTRPPASNTREKHIEGRDIRLPVFAVPSIIVRASVSEPPSTERVRSLIQSTSPLRSHSRKRGYTNPPRPAASEYDPRLNQKSPTWKDLFLDRMPVYVRSRNRGTYLVL